MSLPALYAVPQTPEEWQRWAFNHAASHYNWITQIAVQKKQNLTQYLLNPVDPENFGFWLYNHQAAHNEANAALGTQGFNLLEYDVSDPNDLAEFLQLNGDEHLRISAVLGIG